eukprot:m.201575 g.201575  ORF g.201575 m.201575 type:complete len:160 (+) comp32801_c1_seq1:424-903(+)
MILHVSVAVAEEEEEYEEEDDEDDEDEDDEEEEEDGDDDDHVDIVNEIGANDGGGEVVKDSDGDIEDCIDEGVDDGEDGVGTADGGCVGASVVRMIIVLSDVLFGFGVNAVDGGVVVNGGVGDSVTALEQTGPVMLWLVHSHPRVACGCGCGHERIEVF